MACQSNGVSRTDGKIKFTINLVRDKEDLDDDNVDFPPAIVPRVIEAFDGDTGDVIPRISLSFWSSSLKTLISTNINGNQQIDKIIMDLKEDLPINYHNQRNDFLTLYEEEFATHFKPHGKMIQVFDRKVNRKMRVFEIYFSDFANADESFKEYHRRMESFALLFIDGAVRITVDPRWCIFTLYEVQKTPKLRYHFVGFSTVYRFHSFPDKIRPRISQFVIIPPFQRCGIGKQLLRVEQNYLIDTFNILEITVEEPCEAFYEMRDIVDAERILTSYPSFVPQILDSNPSSKKAVTNEFHKRLFIPNKRVVHMYELVKLYCIIKSDPSKIEELQKEIEGRIKSQRMPKSKSFSPKPTGYEINLTNQCNQENYGYSFRNRRNTQNYGLRNLRAERSHKIRKNSNIPFHTNEIRNHDNRNTIFNGCKSELSSKENSQEKRKKLNIPFHTNEIRNHDNRNTKFNGYKSELSSKQNSQAHGYLLRNLSQNHNIPSEYKSLFHKYGLRIVAKLIKAEHDWLIPKTQNDTNFLTQKQRRHGLRSHEEFLGRPAISLNDIEEQFKGLFIKYENIVEKLISSEPEWNTSKEP